MIRSSLKGKQMRAYVTIGLILLATGASAQQLSMSQKLRLRSQCSADIKRLCPDIAPRDGQLMKCVQAKKSQLSKPCADTIAAVMPKGMAQ